MRVYQLAKVLNVDSKQLIDYCGELGFDIKNQLSALTNEQVDALTTRSKQGAKSGASTSVAPTPAPVIKAPLTNRVQTLPTRAVNRPTEPPPPEPTPAPA